MTTATILVINTGTGPNAGDGDSLRTAFDKINYNFTQVEAQILSIGSGTSTSTNVNLGDLIITGPIISTVGTNEGLVLSPNGTGTVIVQKKLEAIQGIRFSDGSQLYTAINTSTITVSEITSGTNNTQVITNQVTGVSALRFATEAGFTVSDIGQGQAYISMNSTFKYWEIDGQATLIAEGLDTMHFRTGTGIRIVSSSTDSPQSIQFNLLQATTSTLGGVKVGTGLAIDVNGVLTATNLASTGKVLFNETTMYPNSSDLNLVVSNQYGTNGNYLSLPAVSDNATVMTVMGKNGLLLTTNTTTSGPIFITPNNNINGPGDVQIYAQGAYDYTAGVYVASAIGQVFVYPSDVLPALVSASANQDVGAIDIATRAGHTISIRPGGMDASTGTLYVDGIMVVKSIVVTDGTKIGNITSSTVVGGVTVTSSTYLTQAVSLDLGSTVQKLTSGNYYLPPGAEGQQVYFAPKTNANSGTSIVVWTKVVRAFSNNVATTSTNRAWYPFYSDTQGLPYAIYTDSAWNFSNNNLA